MKRKIYLLLPFIFATFVNNSVAQEGNGANLLI